MEIMISTIKLSFKVFAFLAFWSSALGQTTRFANVEVTGTASISTITSSTLVNPVISGSSHVVNVRSYGATGDGATDDTSAVQAAVTAAAGQSVYVPKGTYLIGGTGVMLPSNTRIFGDGYASQLITGTDIHVLRVQGASNASRLSNVTIANLRVTGRDVAWSGTTGPSGIHTGPTGIEVMYANDVIIRDCYIDKHPYDGIGLPYGVDRVLIEGNTVVGCYDDGINPSPGDNGEPIRFARIIGNMVLNSTRDGIHISNLHHSTVTGNTMFNCGMSGIQITMPFNLTVSGNAIARSSTVAGSYGIRMIQGDGPGSKGLVIANNAIKTVERGITSDASTDLARVVITGNMIEGTSQEGMRLVSNGAGWTVSSNIIGDPGATGILLTLNGAGHVIADNQVRTAVTNGIAVTGTGAGMRISGGHIRSSGSNGILVSGVAPNLSINDINIESSTSSAVNVTAAIPRLSIQGLKIVTSSSNGINVTAGTKHVISGNYITSVVNGINIPAGVDKCIVSGNFIDTVTNGLNIASDNNSVFGNIVQTASGTAIITSGTGNTTNGDNVSF